MRQLRHLRQPRRPTRLPLSRRRTAAGNTSSHPASRFFQHSLVSLAFSRLPSVTVGLRLTVLVLVLYGRLSCLDCCRASDRSAWLDREVVGTALRGGVLDGWSSAGFFADIGDLVVDPVAGVTFSHYSSKTLGALGTTLGGHSQRVVDRVGEFLNVERVD